MGHSTVVRCSNTRLIHQRGLIPRRNPNGTKRNELFVFVTSKPPSHIRTTSVGSGNGPGGPTSLTLTIKKRGGRTQSQAGAPRKRRERPSFIRLSAKVTALKIVSSGELSKSSGRRGKVSKA